MPLTVDLIRHAESVLNDAMAACPPEERIIGGRQNEISLSSTGKRQARAFGLYALAHGLSPDRVYSSPAVRTLQTARLALGAIGQADWEVVEDDRLQELDQGRWTNTSRAKYQNPVIQVAIAHQGKDFAAPGGQSRNEVGSLMLSALNSYAADSEPGQSPYMWVFGHGVAIQGLLGRVLGLSHQQTNATHIGNVSLTRLVLEAGLWRPVFVGKQTVTKDAEPVSDVSSRP